MITKQEIADLVLIYINSGEVPDSDTFDERDVWKWVDLLASDAISSYLLQQDSEEILSSTWVKPLKAPIEWDADIQECFLTLPANLLNLPDDAGLRDIRFEKEKDFGIRIIKDGQWDMVRGLTCRNTDATSFYGMLTGTRVVFMDMTEDFAGGTMIIKMIGLADGYNKNEPIPLPPGSGGAIADEIIKRFVHSKSLPNKQNNDGAE